MTMKKKHLKGFTLVEMTVVFVILAIVISLSMGILMSTSNVFGSQAKLGFQQSLGNAVLSFMEEKIKYAASADISEKPGSGEEWDSAGKYNEYIYFQAGRISYARRDESGTIDVSEDDLYGDEFYGEYTVTVLAEVHDTCMTDITVEVYNEKDALVYTTSSTVKLVNLTREGVGTLTSDLYRMSSESGLMFSISNTSAIAVSLAAEGST